MTHPAPVPSSLGDERVRLARGAAFDTLPTLHGTPVTTGSIRVEPADFIVRESLAFELTGTGEHLYLLVRKTGQNTRWVAQRLARVLGLPMRAVGYAGMKDRRAVTEQWFSVHLPGRADPDVDGLDIDGVEVLRAQRHSGKLRIGALRGNWFRIVIRALGGDVAALERRLTTVRDGLVPNYFGAQRFGHGGGNLDLFQDLDAPARLDRQARSFALSALRSALFNNFLAQRIAAGTAATPLAGEILWCTRENGYRHEPTLRDAGGALPSGSPGELPGGIPSGLLWGVGDSHATEVARASEDAFFAGFPATLRLLAAHDVRMMRRPLLMPATDLTWRIDGQQACVEFALSRGQFATAVLRECVLLNDSALAE